MKLILPDKKRCQVEVSSGSFMTFGGKKIMQRCSEVPAYIVKEKKPGADGRRGGMSMCVKHADFFENEGTEILEDYTFTAIKEAIRI